MKPQPLSRPRIWLFVFFWFAGTFLFSVLAFSDAAFDLGLPGNSIGYALLASIVLVAASVLIAPFRILYRVLAFLLFVVLIPVQLIVIGLLLIVLFGMDGVQ